MQAAALNFFDTLIIAGKYQFKPPFPFSPAAEFAGVVESVGAGVAGLDAGDRVLGYGGLGRRASGSRSPAERWCRCRPLSISSARPASRSPTAPRCTR